MPPAADSETDYDPASGRFNTDTEEQTRERGTVVEFSLQLSGTLNKDATPPELEYEFVLDKRGEERGWDCEIEGRGSGRLAIPRRE